MLTHGYRIGCLLLALALAFGCPMTASGQTDEIQVYDAEINKPGEFNLVWHNNYTPVGREEAEFAGGITPDNTLNGVPEWAYGVSRWLELGAYLPLYSIENGEHFKVDGAKGRALLVVPDAKDRRLFYGINFELSYNSSHWEPRRWSGEIRPIIGARAGPVDIVFNPIFDTGFDGFNRLDFAPAFRLAYNWNQKWATALEHYADFGHVSDLQPAGLQQQTLFGVLDWDGGGSNSVEFGAGHGFTSASDKLVIKLMLIHSFGRVGR